MKKAAAFALLALMAAGAAWGQAYPFGSPTRSATATLFSEDADNYLSPISWSDVKADLLFLEFGRPNSASDFYIGASKRLGSFYAAAAVRSDLARSDSGTSTPIQENLVLDGAGMIIGKTATTTYSVNNSSANRVQFPLLVGIGPLGIYNEFYYYDGGQNATFDLSGAPSTSTETVASSLDGTVSSRSRTDYKTGVRKSLTYRDTLGAGYSTAIGAAKLGATLTVAASLNDNSTDYGFRVLSTNAAGGLGYTPAESLDGSAPAAIANVSYFDQETRSFADAYVRLVPGLALSLEMPLAGAWTFKGGIDYSLSMDLYNNGYTDLSGAAQKVAGTATYQHSVEFVPQAFGALMGSVTTESSTLSLVDQSYTIHTIGLTAGLLSKPAEGVAFAFSYRPTVAIYSADSSTSQTTVGTVTTDDGTGAAGAGSSVVTTTTVNAVTGAPYAETWFNNYFNTGLQFFLVPAKFRINLGGSGNIASIDLWQSQKTTTGLTETRVTTSTSGGAAAVTSHTVNTQINSDGSVEFNDSAYNAQSASASYSLGCTYFFAPGLKMDFSMSGGNIFDLGNYTLQVTLTY